MSIQQITYRNQFHQILGNAGLSIDTICNSEVAKIHVRKIWKENLQILKFVATKERIADRKRDIEFLQSWRHSLNQTRYFRRMLPTGYLWWFRKYAKKIIRFILWFRGGF